MKVGIALYYSNLAQYPEKWIAKCLHSLFNQTIKCDIYQLNYGSDGFIIPGLSPLIFQHKELENYAEAMNYIYSWIFEECDVVANVNIDDYYDPRRIELLLQEIENGYDIVSSNYHVITQDEKITWSPDFSNCNIHEMLKSGTNPISNPCHMMHKRVFDKMQFDSSLVPTEDYYFWIKALETGFKIKIRQEFLHYYRMHPLQATHTTIKN
jgi:hypothetical protein